MNVDFQKEIPGVEKKGLLTLKRQFKASKSKLLLIFTS